MIDMQDLPSGAVALAAALADPEALRGRTTLIIASGGNVDADVFARAFVHTDARRAA